jgi:hypothetical protein
MISPSASPYRWNYLIVAGKRAPGLVTISGPGIVIGWDIQSPTGMAGGVTRRKGEPVKEFDAEFDLSDETDAEGKSDFTRWDSFQRALLASVPPAVNPLLGGPTPTRGGKPYPLDVSHPDLARNRITAATIGSIGHLVPDGKGGGKIKVHFIEYRPPKPIGAVKLTKTAGDAKLESQMKTIDALQKEYASL